MAASSFQSMNSSKMQPIRRRHSSEASIDALLSPHSIHAPDHRRNSSHSADGLNTITSTRTSDELKEDDVVPKLRPKIKWRNSWRGIGSENEKGKEALKGRKKSGMMFTNAFRRGTSYAPVEQVSSEDEVSPEDLINFSDTLDSPVDNAHEPRTPSPQGWDIEWFQNENEYQKRDSERKSSGKRSMSWHWLHSNTTSSPNPQDCGDCEEPVSPDGLSSSRSSSFLRRLSKKCWHRVSPKKGRASSDPTGVASESSSNPRKGSDSSAGAESAVSNPLSENSEAPSSKRLTIPTILRRASTRKSEGSTARRPTEVTRLIDSP
jgi:hypothetical protein